MKTRHASLLAVSLFALLGWTRPAWAHGMGWQTDDSFSIVLLFQYDDGEPMAYGQVKVYSPETDDYEYQGGRSDGSGYYSFIPNAPGIWKFVGDDGQGHMTNGQIEVTEADLAGDATATSRPVAQGGAQKPNMFQILLGLSILLNLALASLWLQAKKRPSVTPDAAKEQK